jgi:hypothetical protein
MIGERPQGVKVVSAYHRLRRITQAMASSLTELGSPPQGLTEFENDPM